MNIATIVSDTRTRAKGQKAVVFVSGGIDSTATAALTDKALGKKAVYYFIDNGLQRKGEKSRVKSLFKRLGIKVNVLDAGKEFIQAVSECETGEEKRDLLGEMLVAKALEIAEKEGSKHLVFGTIKNDLLVCKEDCDSIPGFELVEPFQDFTKDQVIEIARKLGLPQELLQKQHFPGVGFAVRIEGRVSKKKLALIRRISLIVEEKVQEMGLHKNLWAYFPFLLSSKVDDKHVIVLRLVESGLGLMAEIPSIKKSQFIELRDAVFKTEPSIGRIYFDLTPKPISLIELM